MCGGYEVYENGTYMYDGVPLCLYVVADPTSRLVRISCVLNCVFFMSMCRSNLLFLVSSLAVSCCHVERRHYIRWLGEPCSTIYVLLGYSWLLLLLFRD